MAILIETIHVITCMDYDFIYSLALVNIPKPIVNLACKYALDRPHIITAYVREYTPQYFSDFTHQPLPQTRTMCWVRERRYPKTKCDAKPQIPFKAMYLKHLGNKRSK